MNTAHEFILRRPAPALASVIDCYVGYRYEGLAPGVHRGLPSHHLTFIVSLENPVQTLALPGAAKSPAACQGFVSGLQTSPSLIRREQLEHGIAVELTPLGARAVLGMPASELASNVVDLADLLGARGRELVERLVEADGWSARFAILDEVLSSGLRRDAGDVQREVAHAWTSVVSGMDAPVESLAEDVGWSRRHLSERFRREVGLPLRQLRRVVRFERSCALLRTGGYRSLSDVAVEEGYFDQAHLNREWSALAGCTPAEWRAEELR